MLLLFVNLSTRLNLKFGDSTVFHGDRRDVCLLFVSHTSLQDLIQLHAILKLFATNSDLRDLLRNGSIIYEFRSCLEFAAEKDILQGGSGFRNSVGGRVRAQILSVSEDIDHYEPIFFSEFDPSDTLGHVRLDRHL